MKLANILGALLLATLAACDNVPQLLTETTAARAGEETIEVGGLAVCRTLALDSELKRQTPTQYALPLWRKRAQLPPCHVQADIVLYDQERGRPVFRDRNPGSMRVVHVPKRLVTQGSVLCLEVHGFPILHAPVTTRKMVGDKEVYTTCSRRFAVAVAEGKVTGDSEKGFRIVAVVDKKS